MKHSEPIATCSPVPRLAFQQFEAAAALGVSRWTLRRETKLGKIKPMTNGNFSIYELRRYVRTETEGAK